MSQARMSLSEETGNPITIEHQGLPAALRNNSNDYDPANKISDQDTIVAYTKEWRHNLIQTSTKLGYCSVVRLP